MTQDVKLPLTSVDVNARRTERLRELFPEAFTEGKLDAAKLRQVLGEDVTDAVPAERYGLSWAGKSDAIKAIQSLSTGTLLPVRDESEKFDTTENLIIEGDNLEVLKLLQGGYHGRVKMIYIDPPYNTGGEFIYPDNYKEGLADYLKFSGQVSGEGVKLTTNTETDGRYHSKWLTMMYPRLFLARNLLREDGVIFVSIDDHEVHNLRGVMNEIFGEENFIDAIVWKKRYGGGAKEKYLVAVHEYILMYAKDKLQITNLFVPLSQEAIERYYKSKDDNFEVRGPYRTHPLESMKSFEERKNLVFPIKAPDGTEVMPKRQWRWSKDRVEKAIGSGELAFMKDKDGAWTIHTKQYLKDDGKNRETKFFSVIDDIYTQHGTNEIIEIFGDAQVFPFPKPSLLIKRLLELATDLDEPAVVVDFFAGSGATAHAVLQQNKSDGGDRRFILVQLPEPTGRKDFPTIAEITKERVRRVSKKLNEADEGKLRMEKASDRGFKVLKLSSSNFKVWEAAATPKDAAGLAEQLKLMAHNVVEDRPMRRCFTS
jgi:adenine-specific DNA-methyltransferase